jgi:fumarate reductase flavoprotein subunit/urocanate reductase
MDSIRGEGIIMAREIGADVVDMDQMQFLYLGQPKTGLLSGVFNVSAEVTVFVNKEGKRFVAEDARRDVISSAVFAQEDGMMYMLHSAESLSDPANQLNIDGIPMKELLDIGAYGWKQGDTLEELAKEIGVPAENLVQTIAEYNEAVDTKNDPFGRTLLNVKMEKGPFYAIPRVPALHHTMGGLRIDTLARVLDTKGEPIPGLYAGGEVTGGIHGGNRLGGNAVTDTVVFGRLAAQSAVAGK